jgi:predicted ATPase
MESRLWWPAWSVSRHLAFAFSQSSQSAGRIAQRVEGLLRNATSVGHIASADLLGELEQEYPDPIEIFKHAFSQLLAPKVLLDPDPKSQQLSYSIDGTTFPISSLSSGEREVVNIVFDFLLRSPSDCIVVFDEPEIRLHPELSYKLLQTLRTLGRNNQFIFCTHSAEIITASLDNTVVFVSPPRADGSNQAITVREDDDTNQALAGCGKKPLLV